MDLTVPLPGIDTQLAARVEEALGDDLRARDAEEEFRREHWTRCAELGALRGLMPAEYGGEALPVPGVVRRLESIGYGCPDNGLTLGLNAQHWTVQVPLLEFGSAAQKQRYLAGMVDGSLIGCHGISEPGAGSDPGSMETVARRVDGGFVLDGHKTWVTMAGVADLAVVGALTDPEAGSWGMSALLVPAGTPGFRQERRLGKMGLRTIPFGDLHFEDCFVPEDHLLGPEGGGMSLFHYSMGWERGLIQASHVGAGARLVERCVAHARERRQFDRPIGSFQAVSHRIADMRMRLDTARLHLYRVAALKEAGDGAVLEASIAKLSISEALVANAESAVRTFGARGYVAEGGIDRELRDAVGAVIYAGTNDMQRNIIASLLGLSP